MEHKFKRFLYRIDFKSIFFALVGAFVIALGTYVYADSDIPKGGIIGLCFIIESLTGVSIVISNLVINAFCYLFAWRLMGTRYIVNAGISTLGFTLFYSLLELLAWDFSFLDNYYLLAALLGAALIEIGSGISIRYGSAPDGEHALSVSLEARGEINTAWFNFISDFSVIIASVVYVQNASLIIFALVIATLTIPLKEIISKYPRRTDATRVSEASYNRSKKHWVPILCVGLAIIVAVGGVALYLGNYYHADEGSVSKLSAVSGTKRVELADGIIAYEPEKATDSALVFYPGGKVEYTAYEPLLAACAQRGVLAIVVHMPANLAVFGINRAIDVIDYYPEIEHWYVGGHSLGGSMAASCAAANRDVFDGVVMLAAYSTADISDMRALSVYGSRDEVLNFSKYEKYKSKLPRDYAEHIIIGGNHAYFGVYGEQDGDGEAIITNGEQINEAARYIAEFIIGK